MRCRPALLILENNHVLVMKYQYGTHFIYGLPGGNTDPGESFPETVARECLEELGIDVEVGPLLLMGEILATDTRPNSLHILFSGEIVGGIPVPQANETTALEAIWMPVSQLHEIHLYPNVGLELQDLIFTQSQGRYIGTIDQPWID
jgi:8-oxo-dGTP diphosphatase